MAGECRPDVQGSVNFVVAWLAPHGLDSAPPEEEAARNAWVWAVWVHRQPARLPVGWEFGSFAMNAAIPQDHTKKERDLPLFYLRIEEH